MQIILFTVPKKLFSRHKTHIYISCTQQLLLRRGSWLSAAQKTTTCKKNRKLIQVIYSPYRSAVSSNHLTELCSPLNRTHLLVAPSQ